MSRVLVLGLGNPILTDDGVGIHVVRAVAESSPASAQPHSALSFAEAGIGGLRLLEVITGYDRVILIDAIRTPGGNPGAISWLGPGDLQASLHAGSTHDLTLPGALALGRSLGMLLPDDDAILILAIEVADVLTFGETCTPAVAVAIPQAVDEVVAVLQGRARR